MKSKILLFSCHATFFVILFMTINMISCTSMDSKAERNKKIVIESLQFIQDSSYNNLNKYYVEDYVRHCQATPDVVVNSLDDFKSLLREWDKIFTDIEYKTQVVIAEGDLVAFYGSFSGIQTGQMGPFPPTGKRMNSEFAGYHRIVNDKIAETWVTWDNMVTLQQLGLFPPPPADTNSIK